MQAVADPHAQLYTAGLLACVRTSAADSCERYELLEAVASSCAIRHVEYQDLGPA